MVSVNCTDQFLKFEGATLGHLHKPQKICLPTIRYAGSPLKYSISECSTDNISNPCGTIRKRKSNHPTDKPHPQHELKIICGNCYDLTERGIIPDQHNDYFFLYSVHGYPSTWRCHDASKSIIS